MELKANPIPSWAASFLDCLKHLHQPQRKREKRWYRERERGRERLMREREREREADELGLMELKAKLVSRWAASILDCLKHLHQPRRERKKRGYREGRER